MNTQIDSTTEATDPKGARIDPVAERRHRIISLDPKLILDLLEGRVKVTMNLPSDAKVIAISGSWETQNVELLLSSCSFEPVLLGRRPPGAPLNTVLEWVRVEPADQGIISNG